MLKFLRIPFATSGDKAAIDFPADAGGAVSYSEGYTFDYQRAASDPAVKNIERDKMNGLFFDITTALRELQAQGVPDFITSALNGGTAYSYSANAVVTYSGDLYLSLANSNTALPSDATKWALLPTPARIQAEAYSSDDTVGGTANALTAELTPTVTTLAGQAFRIRAAFANTTTTPTLNLDGTGALVIVKGNNLPLVAGDIPGAGAWLDIKHDVTLGRFVLLNPATGTNAPAVVVIRKFTAGGTFTKTPGARRAFIYGVGGGGGGGSTSVGDAGTTVAGGGGSGVYGFADVDVSTIDGATITIGSGGAASSNGGDTSIGTVVVFPGGLGAPTATASGTFWPGGAANTAAGTGLVYSSCSHGSASVPSALNGYGGSTPYGAGGGLVGIGTNGQNGSGYGSGGSGANKGAANRVGGSGAPGVLIIEERS